MSITAFGLLVMCSAGTPAAVTWEDAKLGPERSKELMLELAKLRQARPANVLAREIDQAVAKINADAARERIKEDGQAVKASTKTRKLSKKNDIAERRGDERRADEAKRKAEILELKRLGAIVEGAEKAANLLSECEVYVRYGQLKRVQFLTTQAGSAIAAACDEAVMAQAQSNPRIKPANVAAYQVACIGKYFGALKAINTANPVVGGELLGTLDKTHRGAWMKLRAAKGYDYKAVRKSYAEGIGELVRAGGLDPAVAEYWRGATSKPE